MIKFTNISKNYSLKRNNSVAALKNISGYFPDKGMYFIIGKSGCGKTTLLNILGGIDKIDSGDILIEGTSIKSFSESKLDQYRNNYVGMVFQDHNLLDEYNVSGNISLSLNLQNSKSDDLKIINILSYVGMDGYEKRKINELSGGQKQRVAIARALVKESKLLLCDEPTGSLDSVTGKEIFELLKDISKEKLIIIVSHDKDSAEVYGDGIIEMSDGKIVNSNILNSEDSPKKLKLNNCNLKLVPKLKWAAFSFLKKPVRLLVIIFLSVFSFAVTAAAFNFIFWKPYSVEDKILDKYGNAFIKIKDTLIKEEYGSQSIDNFFTIDDEIELRNQYSGALFYNVYLNKKISLRFSRELTDRESRYFTNDAMGVCMIDEIGLKTLNTKLVAGEYPSSNWSDNDIAISLHMYESFELLGFKTNDNEDVEINNYSDILGKQRGDITIKGIIDTNYDLEEYKLLKNYCLGLRNNVNGNVFGLNLTDYISHYGYYEHLGLGSLIYKKKESGKDLDLSMLLIKYDSDYFQKNNIVKEIVESDKYEFADYYSYRIGQHYEMSATFGKNIMNVAIFLLIFSCILFSNFIVSNIKDRMGQIGILRALGTKKKDITQIYIIQNLTISLVIFIISSLLLNGIFIPMLGIMFNTMVLTFPIYEAGLNDYLLLLGITTVTSIIASIFPLIRLSRKSPREIIYGK